MISPTTLVNRLLDDSLEDTALDFIHEVVGDYQWQETWDKMEGERKKTLADEWLKYMLHSSTVDQLLGEVDRLRQYPRAK